MASTAVIGIDIGTRSTKAVLVDAASGSVLAETSVDHSVDLAGGGRVEHDADAVWWADTCQVIHRLVTEAPTGTHVGAVGLSSCGPCLVPVDDAGRALRAGILYGIDTRATRQVDHLAQEWPADKALARFGMPFSSQSTVPKINWVEQHEPEVSARASTWLTTNGYVALRLTGERVMDHHQAAYFAPRYSPTGWIEGADQLPALVWSDAVVGSVTADASRATGLPVGVPVVIGSSDGATDPVGAGLGAGSTALLRYGSTLGITIVADGVHATAPGLWRTPGNRRGELMFVGGLSTAGSVTSWFREQFARDLGASAESTIPRAHRMLLAEAADSPPGAHGVLTLPYFAGERTPFSDPDARGVIAGVGLATTRGDLYRSVLEGAAFGLRHLLDVAGTGSAPIARFRSVGGGITGGVWPQIVADVTGVPQDVVTPHLGAPLGAARLAAEGTGLIVRDAVAWAGVSQTIQPRAEVRPAYDRLYELFRRLYRDSHDVVLGLKDWRS